LCNQAFALLGDCESAENAAREMHLFSEVTAGIDWCDFWVAYSWATTHGAHRAREALASMRALLDRHDALLVANARVGIALAHVAIGDFDAAELEAAPVVQFPVPHMQAASQAVLAVVALHRGQAAHALALAERGLAVATSGARFSTIDSILPLARAQALRAIGRTGDAQAAVREARDRILSIAATINDAKLRESYVTHVDANARTLKLAREWAV
jgi:hypothetical protein